MLPETLEDIAHDRSKWCCFIRKADNYGAKIVCEAQSQSHYLQGLLALFATDSWS